MNINFSNGHCDPKQCHSDTHPSALVEVAECLSDVYPLLGKLWIWQARDL